MDILSLLAFLLSCMIQEVGAEMKLSPEELTVLRGEEAQFTCSTTNIQWAVMTWQLNQIPVLTIHNDTGVLPVANPDVSAKESPDSPGDWVFSLKNIERQHRGEVTCNLQDIDRRTASLSVQEKGNVKVFGDNKLVLKGESALFECQAAGWYPEPSLQWQVGDKLVSQSEYNISIEESGKDLFTVTSFHSVTAAKSSHVVCLASVSALTRPLNSSVRLTVESSTKEAIWFSQSGSGGGSVAEATGGQFNPGYTSEGPTDAVYNELFIEAGRTMDFATFTKVLKGEDGYSEAFKVPDVVSSSSWSESQTQASLSEESSNNVRRITTV
ncbi:immunoglobulin superfamily member 5 isoform X4 [Acanthopagrus latus]|uniref:immunoglobulin superfamily member 5 isoform X4 n=1 Tax=Acanthopagrus latus TaxID=8177 RepID=UPI00187C10AE|nr:immunoglobulin superfamily member 5 isoform X4 [Acanthopagrus latus]